MCFGDLSKAIIFRNKCRQSDKHFRESVVNFEQATWSNELIELNQLQTNEFKPENILSTSIKTEPDDSENFFFDDYPPLRPEVTMMMMNESSTEVEDDWTSEPKQLYELKSERRRARSEKMSNDEKVQHRFACTQCDQILSTSKTLKYHLAVKHGEGGNSFPCTVRNIYFI